MSRPSLTLHRQWRRYVRHLPTAIDDELTIAQYYGHVDGVRDVLLIAEACRLGLLPTIKSRLSETKRHAVRSGSVFVWVESEAGIKRWTDSKTWSPSRLNGSFLVYHECFPKELLHDLASHPLFEIKHGHRGDYCYLPGGLNKRTISVSTTTSLRFHMVIYYTEECSFGESTENRLRTTTTRFKSPSTDPFFGSVELPLDLYPTIESHTQFLRSEENDLAANIEEEDQQTPLKQYPQQLIQKQEQESPQKQKPLRVYASTNNGSTTTLNPSTVSLSLRNRYAPYVNKILGSRPQLRQSQTVTSSSLTSKNATPPPTYQYRPLIPLSQYANTNNNNNLITQTPSSVSTVNTITSIPPNLTPQISDNGAIVSTRLLTPTLVNTTIQQTAITPFRPMTTTQIPTCTAFTTQRPPLPSPALSPRILASNYPLAARVAPLMMSTPGYSTQYIAGSPYKPITALPSPVLSHCVLPHRKTVNRPRSRTSTLLPTLPVSKMSLNFLLS